MAFELRDGQGVLFLNAEKLGQQPDWRGVVRVAGREYELAAWARVSRKGDEYLSVKVSEPYEKPLDRPASVSGPSDEIPF